MELAKLKPFTVLLLGVANDYTVLFWGVASDFYHSLNARDK